MTKIISLDDNATINTELFSGQYQEALRVLCEVEALQQEYKDIVEQSAKDSKLKPAKISKYFKARFKATTKSVVEEGSLFEALNEVLDN